MSNALAATLEMDGLRIGGGGACYSAGWNGNRENVNGAETSIPTSNERDNDT